VAEAHWRFGSARPRPRDPFLLTNPTTPISNPATNPAYSPPVTRLSRADFHSNCNSATRILHSTTFAMAFFWDDDPLAGLPECTPHLGRSGSQSSAALSSLPASPTIQQNTIDVVSNSLSEYRPIHSSDDTAKVLRAFVDNLSGPGLSTLQSDIVIWAHDPPKLRQLRNFLVDAILKPSMFLPYLPCMQY